MRQIPFDVLMEDREPNQDVLREKWKILQVPKIVPERRKHAMQYGSGIPKVITRYSKNAQFYPISNGI